MINVIHQNKKQKFEISNYFVDQVVKTTENEEGKKQEEVVGHGIYALVNGVGTLLLASYGSERDALAVFQALVDSDSVKTSPIQLPEDDAYEVGVFVGHNSRK